MKELRTMKMQYFALAVMLIISPMHSYNDPAGCAEYNAPLRKGSWGFMPFIGLAPGIFTFRDSPHRVIPRAALTCPTEGVYIGGSSDPFCLNIYKVLTSPEDALQIDCPKDPAFSTKFHNTVLHVGGEISYNVCDNVQYFIDAVYNQANGRCFPINTQSYQSPDGCNSCSNTNDCCTISATQPVLGETNLILDYTAYKAYGVYFGTRYFGDRIWCCDRVSLFGGFKIGMLHRKAIHADITIGDISIDIGANTYLFAGSQYQTTDFCKSNAVSGGGLIGLDYQLNDCLSVLISAEIVATSPLKINPNIKSLPSADPTLNGLPTPEGFSRNFALPVGLSIGHVGSLLQFPVWAGIRWNFDIPALFCS